MRRELAAVGFGSGLVCFIVDVEDLGCLFDLLMKFVSFILEVAILGFDVFELAADR